MIKLEIGLSLRQRYPLLFARDTSHPSVAGKSFPLRPGLSLHELIGTVYESKSKRFRRKRIACWHCHSITSRECPNTSSRRTALPFRFPQVLPNSSSSRNRSERWSMPAASYITYRQNCCSARSGGCQVRSLCALLRHMGAVRVITVDGLAERLRISTRMGATHVFGQNAGDLKAAVLDLTNGLSTDP